MNQKKGTSQKSNIDRKTANKIFVKDLMAGTYIKRPGWDPSGVITRYGEISRVNIVGLVVSVSSSENSQIVSFLLDDGTGNIEVRFFEQPPFSPKIGDMIRIVARVRENNNVIYLVPEIMKPVDKRWHEVQNLEIKLIGRDAKKLPVEIHEEHEVDEAGPYQKVLNTLAVLDKGEGVDVQDIVNHLKIRDCENIVNRLIEEGEIFELSPGRVKILE